MFRVLYALLLLSFAGEAAADQKWLKVRNCWREPVAVHAYNAHDTVYMSDASDNTNILRASTVDVYCFTRDGVSAANGACKLQVKYSEGGSFIEVRGWTEHHYTGDVCVKDKYEGKLSHISSCTC
ncbi:hypothetical protein STVA_22150 [Allostella vacuolata]|nr:hypothetical protein STVA_22150 [Stella vacuolata]